MLTLGFQQVLGGLVPVLALTTYCLTAVTTTYICWGQRHVYVKRVANGLGLSLNVTVRTHEDALDNDTFASSSNIPKDCHVQSNFIDCEKERFNPVVCLVLLFCLQTSTRMTLHWRSRRHSAVQSERAFSWQRPSVGLSVTTNM